MSQRFSYVKYTEKSTKTQEEFKRRFVDLESFADRYLPESRARSLFFTHLEEAYMWTGKAIRDQQVAGGSQTEHVAERTN